MGTRIAVVAMVKDECDIIELFVRVNARSVDHLFVVDHNSRDGTRDILLQLRAQGLPLTIFHHQATDFQQSLVLSSLARQLAVTNEYDFILPLDADEFIHSPAGELRSVLAQEVPADACGSIEWMSYVPVIGDYRTAVAPLYDTFRQSLLAPRPVYKVAIRNVHAKECLIAEGNHGVSVNGQWLRMQPLSVRLQHVPVRSPDQILAKALLGSRRLSIKPGRSAVNEGSHWDVMAEKFRAKHYRLTTADALEMAYLYASDPAVGIEQASFDEQAARIGLPTDRIEFIELAQVNVLRKFDEMLGDVCAALRSARSMPEDPAV